MGRYVVSTGGSLSTGRLAPSNALGIRKFGSELHCTALVAAADTFIQKRFAAVTESDEFVQLEERELRDLIARDQLHVDTEELVGRAARSHPAPSLSPDHHLRQPRALLLRTAIVQLFTSVSKLHQYCPYKSFQWSDPAGG